MAEMAERGKRTPDEARARASALLVTGHKMQDAADAAGVTIETLERWLRNDPEFRALLRSAGGGLTPDGFGVR